MRIPDYTVSQFTGLNTFIKDKKTLKPGVATSSKNWVTAKYGDHIELRRGQALLGQTRETGAGKITGLGIGIRADGTVIPFWTHGRKIKYYDVTTDNPIEVGTDTLDANQDGIDCWIDGYQGLAGAFVYVGGRFTSTKKIPVASPGSAVDQAVNNMRFNFLRFGQGRAFAGRRNGTVAGNKDDTGLYLSHIDKALLSDFSTTSGEAYGTGDGSTRTFAHTLAAVTAAKTAMYVSVTDGTETFQDDRNGLMVGTLGGTGTINYATGQVSVTFNTAPANLQAITTTYYTEDATSGGVLDFDTSVAGAGKAKIYRQDDGGLFMSVFPFLNVEYALHTFKAWALSVTLDDTDSTNLPYRKIGVPYPWAAIDTPDGILIVDTSNPTEPKVRRLELSQFGDANVLPQSISDALDLSNNEFDYGVSFRWGEYDIICCQELVNGVANTYNSVMYVRNVYSKAWDMLDFRATRLTNYLGSLLAGDPISNNVYVLFSGFDDDGAVIDNYWQDGQLNLGTNNLKIVHHMRVTGLIQRDQNIEVYLILDDGTPVLTFTIEGSGSYVDQGINTPIGSYTLGSKVIGGGGEATAHPFDVTFPVHTDRCQYISSRFVANSVGYAAINSYTYKDIRDKGTHSLPIKTV